MIYCGCYGYYGVKGGILMGILYIYVSSFFFLSSCREMRIWYWYDIEYVIVFLLEYFRWMYYLLGFRYYVINKVFCNNFKVLFSLSL